MTNEEFKAWLIGYITLSNNPPLTAHQVKMIINHANLAIEIDGALSQENQDIVDNLKTGEQLYITH